MVRGRAHIYTHRACRRLEWFKRGFYLAPDYVAELCSIIQRVSAG